MVKGLIWEVEQPVQVKMEVKPMKMENKKLN
jgi:hypothetical protein